MIGSTVQKYRIVQELGSGAMGAVYEAVDTFTERPVAMKVLRADLARQPELIERFRSEAVTLARLNHPNIALLYDFFREGEDYCMAMEFVRGQPLESIIRRDGCLEAHMAVRVISQTLDALAHAHCMGVLHRDIKPANILVTGDGRVKVTDFGIARVLGSSRMTRHGRIIGTLEYIAPERIRGDESDPRSDLYSAGVVLYEMLTGKLPFAAQTDFELIKAHLEQEPPVLEGVLGTASPAAWDEVVQKAMAKSAPQRFQTAEEFCRALPAMAMAAQAGTLSPAITMKPTRLAVTASLETVRAPEPQPEQDLTAWPVEPVSGAPDIVRKKPPIAVIFGAAGVLAAVLVLALVLRIRTSDASKEKASPAAGQTTVVASAPPLELPEPQNPGESKISIKPASGPAGGSSKTNQTTPKTNQTASKTNQVAPKTNQPPSKTSQAALKTNQPSSTAGPSAQPPDTSSAQVAHASLPAAPPQTTTVSLPPPKPPTPNAPVINSIRDVRKLYIESMPNDNDEYLDEYIKAEILRQIPERLTVVRRREEADAIMKGTATNHGGSVTIFDSRDTTQLWAGEAGDMGLHLTKIHGGEKKVAERLVSNLKKAMQ